MNEQMLHKKKSVNDYPVFFLASRKEDLCSHLSIAPRNLFLSIRCMIFVTFKPWPLC
jgi:hypothetical protein